MSEKFGATRRRSSARRAPRGRGSPSRSSPITRLRAARRAPSRGGPDTAAPGARVDRDVDGPVRRGARVRPASEIGAAPPARSRSRAGRGRRCRSSWRAPDRRPPARRRRRVRAPRCSGAGAAARRRLGPLLVLDDEAQVDLVRAHRDHLDVDVAERGEDARAEARSRASAARRRSRRSRGPRRPRRWRSVESSRRSAGSGASASTVIETLTSAVATRSTLTRRRPNTSNSFCEVARLREHARRRSP